MPFPSSALLPHDVLDLRNSFIGRKASQCFPELILHPRRVMGEPLAESNERALQFRLLANVIHKLVLPLSFRGSLTLVVVRGLGRPCSLFVLPKAIRPRLDA